MLDAHRIDWKLWVGSSPFEEPVAPELTSFAGVFLCAEELQGLDLPVQTYGVPMDDAERPPNHAELQLAMGAAELAHRMTKVGKRVLITCAQGVNRSAFVTALVLMRRGHGAGEAIRMIRHNRKPPCGMEPLSNRYFVSTLRSLDRLAV